MTLSAEEQYLLELINRARLNPVAEAARNGIDLNQSLTAGTLQGGSRQVLAPNALLESAATAHTLWMLANDVFSHTGVNGSTPWARAGDAGYVYSTVGENIAWRGTSASSFDVGSYIEMQHNDLFLSAGHRVNMLNDSYREIGLGQETGYFNTSGRDWNSSMLTELFGTSGSRYFVTGVAYTDRDANDFYGIGEGLGGVQVASGAASTTTAAAGGYALGLAAGTAVAVNGTVAGKAFSLTVDLSQGNVKLDIVGGTEFFTSGSITLRTGIHCATLLGLDDLSLAGNAYRNVLIGNAGRNDMQGRAGNDVLYGNDGNDRLGGGDGDDRLYGGNGNDSLAGGAGIDQLSGGYGNDYLRGDGGNDGLSGGLGADRFVFGDLFGADAITDFALAEGDRLRLDNALWDNLALTDAQMLARYATVTAAGVLLDFGDGGSLLLQGLTATTGLAAAIDVF